MTNIFDFIENLSNICCDTKKKNEKKKIVWCSYYMLSTFEDWKGCERNLKILNERVKEFEKDDFYVGYFVGIKQNKKTLWQDLV